MSGRNVTRVDLSNAALKRIGPPRRESAELARQILDEICRTLAAGGTVKLSSFGIFCACEKARWVGRSPNTREVVPVEARQSITFNPSPLLKACITGRQEKPRPG